MRWAHAEIIGAIGSDETVAHTLNFRTAPAADADQTAADLLTLGGVIRDQWIAFLGHAMTAGTVASKLPAQLVYKEVRTAYLEQTDPAGITTHVSPKTGHLVKDFHYPRPTYLVPTQYTPFVAGAVKGTGTDVLPYEVAMVVSLKTNLRGPRNRGRLYLGPLSTAVMAQNGQFDTSVTGGVEQAFRDFVHAINVGSNYRLHIASRAYATSEGVSSVTVGAVPDSQRRRRRSRPESYLATIAT